ncbi:TadE/TadG family type IV pilus assembly protein [Aurantiacibacter aquimixticola]|uniref:Pilus assembly protein n=1 Tax=Aurantiacibacter aquimixticola TaxID=1958945 RepID=A0A419RRZ9_9SPHN|nr:TadE family protein [Aurantiacibacter aquimixticola]RJY08534.1 pilus assembly protein [Aurantiacibacter aquimixticola]
MIIHFIKRMLKCCEAVAMVEFALVFPLLLLTIFGGVELANYAVAHNRINQMAMTVADNAGRIPVAVDEANIYEVFAGVEVIGEPLDFEKRGRVVLSSLHENREKDSRKGQMIGWQRCWGDLDISSAYAEENDGKSDASLKDGLGASGNRITAAPDTAVMFAEVTYLYKPIVSAFWSGPAEIRHESAFNVRGRVNQSISNGNRLDVMRCN